MKVNNAATSDLLSWNRPGLFSYLFIGFLLLNSDITFGDYKDDIGYTRLAAELGVELPEGSGVNVTQVEADSNNDDPDIIISYSPDPTGSQFAGKTITDITVTSTAYSGHATGVGGTFYGNTNSVAPGISNIESYEANNWLTSGFLRSVKGVPGPKPALPGTSSRIANHSWVGTSDDTENTVNTDILRRVDWVIETDEFIQVVGTNNGSTTKALLSGAYNTVSVGRTDAGHATGTIEVDSVYIANRTRPDIVAPAGSTSAATPMVAAATALLVETGHGNPGLSTDLVSTSTTNRNGDVIYNAERAEVIKATLMAGADRTTTNTNTSDITDYRDDIANQTDNGLDSRFGAGQLNIFNNHHIIAAGEQNSVDDAVSTGGLIGISGFDYDPSFGGDNGSNSEAFYFFSTEIESVQLATSLVWNIDIDGGDTINFNATATLFNLDLFLYDITGAASVDDWQLLESSESLRENTENIWMMLDSNRDYAIQVKAGSGQAAFEWDYALAWQITPVPTINNSPAISGSPATTVLQDTAYSFVPVATDVDGDTLLFSITNKPSWAGFNTDTGELSGTPDNSGVGITTGIVITVDDQQSSPNSTASLPPFDLAVSNVNDAPTITSIDDQVINEDSTTGDLVFTVADIDTDPDALFVTANSNNQALINNALLVSGGTGSERFINVTPAQDQNGGPVMITVIVSDGVATTATTFDVFVTPVNDPPVAINDVATVDEDGTVNINLASNDTDIDDVLDLASINIASLPVNGTITAISNGTVDYHEVTKNVFSDSFTYTIDDKSGDTSNIATANITIIPPDSNGDGISDAAAIALGLYPNDPDGDTDDDGIKDVIEVGGDVNSPLDSDGDGVSDALEPGADATDASLASGLPSTSGGTVSISTSVGESLSMVSISDAAGGPGGINFRYGLISYTTTAVINATVTVRMVFPTDLPTNLVIYKVDNAGFYTKLPNTIWTLVNSRSVDITLTDGDPLTDLDGAPNNSIHDPIALGEVVSAGGGGCTINNKAGMDPTWPLLLILPSIGYLRRRKSGSESNRR